MTHTGIPKDTVVMILRLILLLHHLGQLSTAPKGVHTLAMDHVTSGKFRL